MATKDIAMPAVNKDLVSPKPNPRGLPFSSNMSSGLIKNKTKTAIHTNTQEYIIRCHEYAEGCTHCVNIIAPQRIY